MFPVQTTGRKRKYAYSICNTEGHNARNCQLQRTEQTIPRYARLVFEPHNGLIEDEVEIDEYGNEVATIDDENDPGTQAYYHDGFNDEESEEEDADDDTRSTNRSWRVFQVNNLTAEDNAWPMGEFNTEETRGRPSD